MPTNAEAMMHMLAPFEPTRGLDALVVEVNQLYHDLEAATYDRRHPEVHRQLPQKWAEMVRQVTAQPAPESWSILDFGCGTGFEAEQLVRLLPTGSVQRLVCYDPSTKMLARCESRIRGLFPQAVLASSLAAIVGERFNLLATNSLLHHLPNPMATIAGLAPLLTDDAVWLAGHEPSARYYRNAELAALLGRYEAERRWRRFLIPKRYVDRIGLLIGLRADPLRSTAQAAVERGLFRRPPSRQAIDRLVDFHVAHSTAEARVDRGFDVLAMRDAISDDWELRWRSTYSYMGPHYEGTLPARWSRASRDLAARFPDDGANFCAVWRRRS